MEKTYIITESELQSLLEKQRINCTNADEQYWKNGLKNGDGYSHILKASTPDLSHLKEAQEQK
jgi:hypothetical protein